MAGPRAAWSTLAPHLWSHPCLGGWVSSPITDKESELAHSHTAPTGCLRSMGDWSLGPGAYPLGSTDCYLSERINADPRKFKVLFLQITDKHQSLYIRRPCSNSGQEHCSAGKAAPRKEGGTTGRDPRSPKFRVKRGQGLRTSARAAPAATVRALDDPAHFQLAFGDPANAVCPKIGVPCLNAAQAA